MKNIPYFMCLMYNIYEVPVSAVLLCVRTQGRRSVYLAKLLQKRATVEELRTRGIIRDNAVFGCALEHQMMHSTNTSQVG